MEYWTIGNVALVFPVIHWEHHSVPFLCKLTTQVYQLICDVIWFSVKVIYANCFQWRIGSLIVLSICSTISRTFGVDGSIPGTCQNYSNGYDHQCIHGKSGLNTCRKQHLEVAVSILILFLYNSVFLLFRRELVLHPFRSHNGMWQQDSEWYVTLWF